MKRSLLTLVGLLGFLTVGSAFCDDVAVKNATNYPINITIEYALCRSDRDIDIAPGQTKYIPAGACLLTDIYGKIAIPGEPVMRELKRYSSTGTRYRTFQVQPTNDGEYAILRP